MKKFVLVAAIVTFQAQAREINEAELIDRQPIDGGMPTLLVFTEPANLALTSSQIGLQPMTEGDASSIWKATPNAGMSDVDLEFVLASGKHLLVKLKVSSEITDHVLTIKETPTFGSVDSTRNKIVPLARQTFLRVVRNAPALPKADEEVPESFKSFANEWRSYKTEQLLLFVGSNPSAKKEDVESFKDSHLVLVGFYDNSMVVIFRRKA